LLISWNNIMRNRKQEIWDSRGGLVVLIHVALSSTHRISIALMSSNRNIISILVRGIPEYPCSKNNDSCNRNTETINTCIQVNLCSNVIRTGNNCVQSIHVEVIQIYVITISSGIAYPCISGTWTLNNSVRCNSICVTVIRAHEIIVSSIASVYMKYNVQCTGVSSVLDDTSTVISMFV